MRAISKNKHMQLAIIGGVGYMLLFLALQWSIRNNRLSYATPRGELVEQISEHFQQQDWKEERKSILLMDDENLAIYLQHLKNNEFNN